MGQKNGWKSKLLVDLILGCLILILVTIVSPILLTVFLILVTWRYFVITLASLCIKDIDGAIFGHDMLFVTDSYFNKPTAALPGALILQGKVDMPEIWRHFTEVLSKRRSDGRTLIYDNLLQYPIEFMGYCFWKWDADFNIQNHIKLLNDQDINLTHDNLAEFTSTLTRLPFTPKRPLWDITIIPHFNDDEEQFVTILRIHHSMCDGLSAMKFLLLGSMGLQALPPDMAESTRYKKSTWQKLVYFLKLGISAPYLYLKMMVEMQDDNCIQNDENSSKKTGIWYFTTLPVLDLQELKKAKNDLNNSFSAVLLSAISGGFEKFFESTYGPPNVPEKIHSLSSFFYPNHPNDQLTNKWTILIYELKLRFTSMAERLEVMKHVYQKATESCFPVVSFLGFMAVGLLPKMLVEVATKFKSSTLVTTNVPGPTIPCTLFGCPILDMIVWFPLIREVNALGIAIISYNGSVRITVNAEKSNIGSQANVNRLGMLIYHELQYIIEESKKVRHVSISV